MFQLRISPEAANDLVEIKEYISQELGSPQAAAKLVSRIIKRIRDLPSHPDMGAPLSGIIDIHTDYRFLVCARYLVFYRCENEIVSVSRILYGRRDYTHILFGDLPEDSEE